MEGRTHCHIIFHLIFFLEHMLKGSGNIIESSIITIMITTNFQFQRTSTMSVKF